MLIEFFGQKLVDERKLTEGQLIQALDYQSLRNLSLGEWAVKEEFITLKEADMINHKQRIWDKRFGEVAETLGLLNYRQIRQLLKLQKENKVTFVDVVILKGFMKEDDIKAYFSLYQEAQTIQTHKLDAEIEQIDKNGLMRNAINVLEKLYFRIIHDEIRLMRVNKLQRLQREGIIALQKMRGDEIMDFALQPEDPVSLNIATNFLKMPFENIDEVVCDVLGEFVNISLGNIAVGLSEKDIVVDLAPQQIVSSSDFDYSEYYTFDFATAKGGLTLCLKL